MKGILVLLLCLLMLPGSSQDLTGTWEGSGGTGAPFLRLVIKKCGNKYFGFTYDRTEDTWCRANFQGSFDASTKVLSGRGVSFISNSYNHVLSRYSLVYNHKNGEATLRSKPGVDIPDFVPERLRGYFYSIDEEDAIFLQRVSRMVETTPFMKDMCALYQKPPSKPVQKPVVKARPQPQPKATTPKPAPKPTPPPVVVVPPAGNPVPEVQLPNEKPKPMAVPVPDVKLKRKNDLLHTIITDQPKLTLVVYDNGIEDGDSISIMHNNVTIAANRRITVAYQQFEILLDTMQTDHEITFIAHNLGSIPPNTATLEIIAGTKKYALTASTDLSKNAVIRIRYQPSAADGRKDE